MNPIARTIRTALLLPALVTVSVSLQGQILVAEAFLDGPSESPPVASPGTGFARVTYDAVARTLKVEVTFSGLVGITTVAHIHGPTLNPHAGNASVMTVTPTFTGFPAGVTAGDYSQTFDLTLASSWNPSFVTAHGGTPAGAEAAFAAALQAERSYLNVHSNFSPAGEIRGFLVPVPEPGLTGLVTGLGLGALGAWRRFRRS